jgi:glycine cleavage system H protein
MKVAGYDFPDELYYLVDDQVWARLLDDGTVKVGITALGIALAGEIYMCRTKPLGAKVEQGRSVAVVELAKAIVSVRSPLSGSVVEVNPLLADDPGLVHREPYGRGWIARIAAADFEADRLALVHGEPVGPAMARHAMLNRVD